MYSVNSNLIKRNFYNHYLRSRRKFSQVVSHEKWLSVVGLEVHAQISSSSKLFSASSTNFASPVNCNVSFFDCSIPGTLPVLNKRCVEAGILTALALNCQVNAVSMFDRKHYFYADLPAGYQITQQRAPLASNGSLHVQVYNCAVHKKPYEIEVRLKQLQLEQDSGRSLHDDTRSLVDLNRVGIPLMELVFDPDLKDGEEAASLVKELMLILERLNTCSCKMEEGALRVDANVSIHRKGEPFGTRSEIKNISSVRGVAAAVDYEISRQISILKNGGSVINETRSWDAASKTTLPMRDKEQLQDYRYMPEPNLPPLYVAVEPSEYGVVNVNTIKTMIPEMPNETRRKLIEDFKLTLEQAVLLVNENMLLRLFNEASSGTANRKLLANLIINDFLTVVNKETEDINKINIDGKCFKDIADLLENGSINRNIVKMLLKKLLYEDVKDPKSVVEQNNWVQINNERDLEILCKQAVDENPKIVRDYKRGKTKALKALLGIIANNSNKKANMAKCVDILQKLVDNYKQ